jgi:rhodanese-related sulfurtransferase
MNVNKSYAKIKIKKISPSKAYALIKKHNPLIVDVRPEDFIKDSYIIGSIHCQTLEIDEISKKLPKDKKILVVDWAMKQAPIVAQYLKLNGFNILGVLKGGVERWVSEGLPVDNQSKDQQSLK